MSHVRCYWCAKSKDWLGERANRGKSLRVGSSMGFLASRRPMIVGGGHAGKGKAADGEVRKKSSTGAAFHSALMTGLYLAGRGLHPVVHHRIGAHNLMHRPRTKVRYAVGRRLG